MSVSPRFSSFFWVCLSSSPLHHFLTLTFSVVTILGGQLLTGVLCHCHKIEGKKAPHCLDHNIKRGEEVFLQTDNDCLFKIFHVDAHCDSQRNMWTHCLVPNYWNVRPNKAYADIIAYRYINTFAAHTCRLHITANRKAHTVGWNRIHKQLLKFQPYFMFWWLFQYSCNEIKITTTENSFVPSESLCTFICH